MLCGFLIRVNLRETFLTVERTTLIREDDGQEHLEVRHRFYSMGDVCGHQDRFPLGELIRLLSDGDTAFSIQDCDQGIAL